MARKFLIVVAVLIILFLAGLFALRIFADELSEAVFVPTSAFEEQPDLAPSRYADPAMWIARPERVEGNPARWLPPGVTAPVRPTGAAIFFIHPTSYLSKDHWNAPLDDAESRDRARLFVQGMASPFNAAGGIWAPRYRQAAFGAFLTDRAEAGRALDLAYRDVLLAFDRFLAEAPANAPIVLAGHSQGSLHLIRLLRDRVAGKPVARRIVAAYAVGWPVSVTADLPALGLPQCAGPDEAGCLLSWQSFGDDPDTRRIEAVFDRTPGLTGQSRGGSAIVCINPLTGAAGGSAPATANLGTLKPSADLTQGELVPGLVPARCDGRGFLLIGPGPDIGPYVFPGNNYHVYDYPLFWANVRADVARRLAAYRAR